MRFTELELNLSEIVKQISKLNLMICKLTKDNTKTEDIRNLSNGINNCIKTIADLYKDKLLLVEGKK